MTIKVSFLVKVSVSINKSSINSSNLVGLNANSFVFCVIWYLIYVLEGALVIVSPSPTWVNNISNWFELIMESISLILNPLYSSIL